MLNKFCYYYYYIFTYVYLYKSQRLLKNKITSLYIRIRDKNIKVTTKFIHIDYLYYRLYNDVTDFVTDRVNSRD